MRARNHFASLGLWICSAVFILQQLGCTSLGSVIKDPKVKVPDVRVSKMGLTQAELDIVLSVTNPNGIAATAKKLQYALEIDKRNVAKGVFDKDVEIAANKTTTVVVPVVVTNVELVKFLVGVLTKKGVPFRAQGTVKVGPIDVPFDEKGMITSKDL